MKRRAVGVKRPFEKEAQTYSFCQGKGTLEVVTIIFGLICLYFQILIRIFVANL